MGASTAYFLSQLGVPSLLIERAEPACAASGAGLSWQCVTLMQSAYQSACALLHAVQPDHTTIP